MTASHRATLPSASRSLSSAAPLVRLRRRLTAWYVGTFALVLLTLGTLLLIALTRFVARDIDESLRAVTEEIAHATERREHEAALTAGSAIDAVEELRIPGRDLYLFDVAGHAITPPTVEPELGRIAARAGESGSVNQRIELHPEQTLQLHAERFTTTNGHSYVALAAANRDALDDRYASLVVLLAAIGGVGLVLVAGGGWVLARKSVAPVQRSMEHMRRFMSDAAHELRTPVAVLRSRTDVALQREREPAEYVATLEALGREAALLSRIVDDLFTLARADAGDRPLHRELVQFDEVVLEAVSATGALAERRSVCLDVGAADETVLDADPALIRQIVVILLDNAIKFSEPGGTVTVDLHSSPTAATLTVRDTGIGIPQAERERVFDRFYRGVSARGSTSGAGLGLSIAQWIATAHGASIEIESAPGHGTTITVSFPRSTEL